MAASFLTPGTILGHYRLGACIGQGGMGEVYEAKDLALDRRVAVKILSPQLFDRPESVRRFIQEARSASALNHPHILTVHEIAEGEIEGMRVHYIVTELVEGTTLREQIHLERAPLKNLFKLLIDVADALAKAHACGIVHRDLKPENVMVTADGYAKIIDFGIAKLVEPRTTLSADSDSLTANLTPQGGLLGTVGYMAPEQVQQKNTDHRADIFSFGCILYEAATRLRAFSGSSDVDILYKILHEAPPPIIAGADIPDDLRRLIGRCLEKGPNDRYQSMRDVALELRSIATRFENAPTLLLTRARYLPVIETAGVGVVLVLAAIAAMFFAHREPTSAVAPVMRAVARWPSNERECRISPDGRWISFISDRDSKSVIWIRQTQGGEPTILSHSNDDIWSHVWSPRNDQIAYLAVAQWKAFLQFMPAVGGPPGDSIALDDRFAGGKLVRWIGDHIYLEARDGLWQFDVLTRKASKVADGRATEGRRVSFDVRSDEKEITYSVHQGNRESIWVAKLDGSHPVRLTDPRGSYSDYRSRFGTRGKDELIFSSDRTGEVDLWRMALPGRTARQITFSPTVEWIEDVSADGQTMVFQQDRQNSNLWVWDRSSREMHQLTAEAAQDEIPSTSKVGSFVAFQRSKPSIGVVNSDIFAGELSAGRLIDPHLLVSDAGVPHIDPSGRWLSYVKQTGTLEHDLWVRDLRSEHQLLVTGHFKISTRYSFPTAQLQSNLAWARSDQILYVERSVSNAEKIVGTNLNTNESKTLDQGVSTSFHDLRVSGDGRWLAYVKTVLGRPASSKVTVRDLRTQRETTLYSHTHDSHERIFCVGWSGSDRLLILVATVNADATERQQPIELTLSGDQKLLPTIARAFGGTAQIDPSSNTLFLTTVSANGFHDMSMMSLADGRVTQLTRNHLPGVSFAGFDFSVGGKVLFCKQESNLDLWLIDFGHERHEGGS